MQIEKKKLNLHCCAFGVILVFAFNREPNSLIVNKEKIDKFSCGAQLQAYCARRK